MLADREKKIPARCNSNIKLKVIPGHFATTTSHINYYTDLSTLKARHAEAMEVATSMAHEYQYNTPVDTIVCINGTEVIGTCLAEKLTENGIMSLNRHNTMYIITPEFDINGQLIFRDNMQPMVRGKNVLLLLDAATTGQTISKCLNTIKYYGGIIQGISAIFSAIPDIAGIQIHSIFSTADIPDYQSFDSFDCPHCKAGEKIDAIVNVHGYSEL
ncbi:MAG: orotate phosphoribosyltransferase [Eubacterium sp.]|nr:orotate phosphoribosyltransferase [Eubacterium sp.]